MTKFLNNNKVTVFIDESGTLPDPNDKVVIVAAVGTKLPNMLIAITKSIRKTMKNKNLEIKFYKSGENTKKRFLTKLSQKDIHIFTLTVDKQGKKIADSPENFALLCWILLKDCLLFYQNQLKEIVFDRHFHQLTDQQSFEQELFSLLGNKIKTSFVDSQTHPAVNAADMVAGSLLGVKAGKKPNFFNLIKEKVVSEKTVNWIEIKKRFWNKKISPNRCKHPSKRD